MLKKSDNAADPQERLKLLGQSLVFSSKEKIDEALRRRKEVHLSMENGREALTDLLMIVNKTGDDEREIAETGERLEIDVREMYERSGRDTHTHSVAEKHKHLKLFSSKVNIRQEPGRGRSAENL